MEKGATRMAVGSSEYYKFWRGRLIVVPVPVPVEWITSTVECQDWFYPTGTPVSARAHWSWQPDMWFIKSGRELERSFNVPLFAPPTCSSVPSPWLLWPPPPPTPLFVYDSDPRRHRVRPRKISPSSPMNRQNPHAPRPWDDFPLSPAWMDEKRQRWRSGRLDS